MSIVTQLISPILQQRSENGTWVFDLFGGVQEERTRKPDELIIFCVDCSRSMGGSSDFEEANGEENINGTEEKEEPSMLGNPDMEDSVSSNPTFGKMRGK